MDLRTGRTYETLDDARKAGVPDSDIALIAGDPREATELPDVLFITSGPFKGRTYQRNALGQLVRVRG